MRLVDGSQRSRVGLVVTGWSIAIAGVGIYRVWALQSNAADLGFLVHGLATVVRDGWRAPIPWAGWSLIEDHFSPLLLLLSPFSTWMISGYLLVAVQAAALGFAAWQVWRLAEEVGASNRVRWLVLASLLVSPALLFGSLYDVHANLLAAPFIALMLRGVVTHRSSLVFTGGIGASLLREDAALLILIISACYASQIGIRRSVLVGGFSAAMLLGWQLTAGGPQVVRTWSFDHIRMSDPGEFVASVLSGFWGRGGLLAVLVGIAIPWIAFVIPSKRALAVAGLWILPLLLSGMEATESVAFQYYSLVPVVLAAGSLERIGSSEVRNFRARAGWVFVAIALLMGPFASGVIAPLGVNAWGVVAAGDQTHGEEMRTAVSCLRDRVLVTVDSSLTPLTGHLEAIRVFPHPFSGLYIQSGEDTQLLMSPTDETPTYLITAEAFDESAYQRIAGTETVWALEETEDPEFLNCIRDR